MAMPKHYQDYVGEQAEQSSPTPGTLAALVDVAKGQRQTVERIADQLREMVNRIAGAPPATPTMATGIAPRAVPNGLIAAIQEELDRAEEASKQIDGHLARLTTALH